MEKAFADWYCPKCDDALVIDGDTFYFGGKCPACGAEMTNERSGEDGADTEAGEGKQ